MSITSDEGKSKNNNGNGHRPTHAAPKVGRIEASKNPWQVPLLDLRAIVRQYVSIPQNPKYTRNLRSFRTEDGLAFRGVLPKNADSAEVDLRYPTEGELPDGVLFKPTRFTHKWAIFYHRGEITFLRSWLREIYIVAESHQENNELVITKIYWAPFDDLESSDFVVRVFNYLLRSHGIIVPYPAPVPKRDWPSDLAVADWCLATFGSLAMLATHDEIPFVKPEKPLRTDSLLHLAIARGDLAAVNEQIDSGASVDRAGINGRTPLHLSIGQKADFAQLLLQKGAQVDGRSTCDSTPLMIACQIRRNVEHASLLLDAGADPNARDDRGSTSLHRAAEAGHAELVQLLLNRGVEPNSDAEGRTPRSLAEANGKTDVVRILDTI